MVAEVWPTAQTSHDVMAFTAQSAPPFAGLGLVKMLQLLPFQFSING